MLQKTREFRHVPGLKFPELGVETTESGRTYFTPEGNAYPSVTTVIGRAQGHQWLDEWKARVGEEQARRVSVQASVRGEAVHQICEDYLNNKPDWRKGQMPTNLASFAAIKPHLDQNIGLIAGLELPLYSDKLRVAGRVDCIAKWNGIWSIVDFKTSKRRKSIEDIKGYLLQETCYSFMFYERTGIMVPQIVTVMTVDNDEPFVHVDRAANYLPELVSLRNSLDI